MPRKIFTAEQERLINEEWENGLKSYGTSTLKKRVKDLADKLGTIDANGAQMTTAKVESKLECLRRREQRRVEAAAGEEEVTSKSGGTNAYLQFVAERLRGSDGKETSDVFSKAIADYNNIRDNDPTEYDKYKERADAARKKKEEEKNSAEGKIKQIIELCKKQLNDVQALENLGAHVVAYVVFPDGKFCNNSTNKAKQFMEMQNPLFGYTLTSFVHGSSIAPVEWRQPHQDLRSRVQDVINIKYQKALRLFSPGSSGRSFPYRAYHRTGHNAHGHKIHVSGLPSGGTLKDMARYGVADLKEILENKDDIQITLEMSEVSGGDNEMSEVSGGDNEMSEVSGGDNGSNLDLVLDVPVNNNEELGSNLDLVLDVPVNNNEELENTPEDIANLLKEVSKETSKETSGAKKRKGSTSQYTRKTKRGKSKAQKDDKAQYTRKTKRGKSKAQKDDKEFIVEAILGEREKEGGTEYLVKWKGYSAEHNTYEPPAHLENCEIFINYIKNK